MVVSMTRILRMIFLISGQELKLWRPGWTFPGGFHDPQSMSKLVTWMGVLYVSRQTRIQIHTDK